MRRLTSPVFVGRTDDLQRLEDLYREAAAGRAASVIVGGEAGVGKTRLVNEFANRIAEQGGRFLIGGCVEFSEAALAFTPVTEALRPLARERDPVIRAAIARAVNGGLARLAPELAGHADPTVELLPDADIGPLDAHTQGRLFELLLGLLDRLGQERPTVLALEDLHWADASTRDLVAYLVRNLRSERVLLLGTFRSDDLHRRHPFRLRLQELERSGRLERLDLRRFERDETARHLAALLGGAVAPAAVDRIHDRAEGNPFFVEELVAVQGDDRGHLPASLREILLARVDALSDPAQALLRVASVIGRESPEPLLRAVAPVPDEVMSDALREAVAHQLLVPTSEPSTYAFRHALLQEAIYDEVLPTERLRLHAAVAETLQRRPDLGVRRGPALSGELAHHWARANRPTEALAASVAAAEAARAAYAFPEAVGHLERALELWHQVPDPETIAGMSLADIAVRASDGADHYGDTRRAIAFIQEAIRVADDIGDTLAGGLYRAYHAHQLIDAGDGEQARRVYEEALARVPPEPPTLERARTLNLGGLPLLLASRYDEARRSGEEALAAARAVGARFDEAMAHGYIGMACAFRGEVELGVEHLQAARALAEELNYITTRVGSYLTEGIVLEASGRYEDAHRVFLAGAEIARDLGLSRTIGGTLEADAAEALRHLGRWSEAAPILDAVVERGGVGWHLAQRRALRALLRAGTGDLEAAEEDADAAWEAYGTVGAVGVTALVAAARAEVALARRDPERATDLARDGLERLVDSGDLRWRGHLTWLAVRGVAESVSPAPERADAAAGWVATLRDTVEREVSRGTIFREEGPAWVALAEAEVSRVRRSPDVGAWQRAAERFGQQGDAFPTAYARFRESEASLLAGVARSAAAEPLADAWRRASAMGARPLLSEIEALARRARLALPDQGPDIEDPAAPREETHDPLAHAGLTAREREVLVLLADGRTDREIADALFISPKTASVHVTNVKGKLGVGSRVEAATLAARSGLGGRREDP